MATNIDSDDSASYEEVEVEVTDDSEDEEAKEAIEDQEEAAARVSEPQPEPQQPRADDESEKRRVEWPPKGDHVTKDPVADGFVSDELSKKGIAPKMDQPATAKKNVFEPGRLANRWNPVEAHAHENGDGAKTKPNFRLRKVEDFLQHQTSSHRSYHVPPGTSRTKKAQENYTRHLQVLEHSED